MLSANEWMIFVSIVCGAILVFRLASRSRASSQKVSAKPTIAWLSELEIENLSTSSQSKESDHDKLDLWLHRIVSQSGLGLNLETFLIGTLGLALATTFVVLEFSSNVSAAIMSAMCIVGLSITIVSGAFKARRKKFLQQFPTSVNLIASSVAAGQSLKDAIRTTCESIEEPAASEFTRCLEQMNMGMNAASSVERLSRRIPTIDVRIFAHTIAVHEEMGGQLGKTLQRMAMVIQRRRDDIQKAKAATGLGKFAAVMICSIGVLALIYLILFEPDYIGKLFQSTLGQRMAIYAVISEIIGIAVILMVLNNEG